MQHMPGSICVVLVLAGCASPRGGDTCHQRGWIGGALRPVAACGGWFASPPAYTGSRVIGMPAALKARRGLLVKRVPPGSPLAHAGVAAEDLIVAVDGVGVSDPAGFRERIEAHAPGSRVTLGLWRAGARLAVPVVVGRETYERTATVGVFAMLWPGATLDLWPFDDGIDVLGLLTAKRNARRYDLEVPERGYLRAAVPGRTPIAPLQETLDLRVFPLAVGAGVRVRSQEAVAARG